MADIWDAKREKLEKAVTEAVEELFDHMAGCASFMLDCKNGVIVAGDKECCKRSLNRE